MTSNDTGEPSSAPLRAALAQATTAFSNSAGVCASALLTRWTQGLIDPSDAATSLSFLSEDIKDLKQQLTQALTFVDEQITSQTWIVFREVAASEIRLLAANALGQTVVLDAHSTLKIYAVLDVATALQEEDILDGQLGLQLIEEMTERLTVDSACKVFEYLESRVTYLTRDLSPSRGKGLVLLRLLNDLLRRLSKPSRSHLVLSGRILSLLGSVFPLGERSGVNLRGEFNVANATRFEVPQETNISAKSRNVEEDGEDQLGDVESVRDGEDEADKDADPASLAAKDDAFYVSFWETQQWFANPLLLFEAAKEDTTVEETETVDEATKAEVSQISRLKQEDEVAKGAAAGDATPQRPEEGQSRETETEEGAADSKEATPVSPLSPIVVFQQATRRILDVFAEVNAREREVELAEKAASKGGLATSAAKKRKREEMLENAVGDKIDSVAILAEAIKPEPNTVSLDAAALADEEGEFPKYLTGRKVFEYQLRSPPFRRHLLLQYLILLQFLLSFNPSQKEKSEAWKNKQLLAQTKASEFVLSEEDESWIRKTWREIVGLLEETGTREQGRKIRYSVLQTLRRESRWIHWKADSCPPLDKPSMPSSLVAQFQQNADVLVRPRPEYRYPLGTAALSELWEQGLEPIVPGKRMGENAEGMEVELTTDGLEQLELPPGIPSVGVYAKMVKQQESRAEMRRRKLGITDFPSDTTPTEEEKAAAALAAKRAVAEKNDEELQMIEERKTSLNWRALRIARADTLRLWGKIKGGEIDLLIQAEKDEEAEKKRKREEADRLLEQGADTLKEEASTGIDDTNGSAATAIVVSDQSAVTDSEVAVGMTALDSTADTVDTQEAVVTGETEVVQKEESAREGGEEVAAEATTTDTVNDVAIADGDAQMEPEGEKHTSKETVTEADAAGGVDQEEATQDEGGEDTEMADER